MGEKKVSVCVPVYNVERFIERCARSLFAQTMTDGVEFIFVDDCSPDNSIGILRRLIGDFPNLDIKIVAHDVNRGLPAARRTAVEAASGRYIAHIDSDDYVDPEFLQTAYDTATSENSDFVSVGIVDHNPYGYVKLQPFDVVGDADLWLDIWMFRFSVNIWAKLIARQIFVEHPECFAPDDILYGEDLYTMVRAAYFAKKPAVACRHLYHHDRQNENSMMRSPTVKTMIECYARLWVSTVDFLRKAYPDGSREEDIIRGAVEGKAYQTLDLLSISHKRMIAHLFWDVEMPYVRKMGRLVRTAATFAHFKLWPLVWLCTCALRVRKRMRGKSEE